MERRQTTTLLSLTSLLSLFFFSHPATASASASSFSLDTVVPDEWYYVHNHLADTTSAACLAAYAAPIGCDDVLRGIVSSGSPNFDPDLDDVERVCVPSCEAALDAWVANVKAACRVDEGDAALVHGIVRPMPRVPVEVVGQVFLYWYAYACAKDGSSWCYFGFPEWARSDFTCGNGCAEQFFTDAHELPGSNYWFSLYELEDKSDWWKETFAEGWDRVLECREISSMTTISWSSAWESRTSSTSSETASSTSYTESTSTADKHTAATSSTTTTHGTTSSLPDTTTSPSTSASATASAASELPTNTQGSAAGRLRSPFRGIW